MSKYNYCAMNSIFLRKKFGYVKNLSYFCSPFRKSKVNNRAVARRDVAQSGSATVWGTGGRKFESCHPDKQKKQSTTLCFFCISRQKSDLTPS